MRGSAQPSRASPRSRSRRPGWPGGVGQRRAWHECELSATRSPAWRRWTRRRWSQTRSTALGAVTVRSLAGMRLGVRAALVDGRLVPGDVELAGERVARVGLTARGGDGIAAPGLVDLQVNGVPGVSDFHAGDYARAAGPLLRAGTTAVQPTFITAPADELVAALRALPGAIGPVKVIGAHLEGPFIAAGHLGAHPGEHRRDPDLDLLRR